MKLTRLRLLQSAPLLLLPHATQAADEAMPFGAAFPELESLTTGEWWKRTAQTAVDAKPKKGKGKGGQPSASTKKTRKTTFECWPRFAKVADGDKAQFPGWPITISQDTNDGRQVAGWLPELIIEGAENPVVQVIEEATGDILYTVRVRGHRFQPRVYAQGKHTIKVNPGEPTSQEDKGLEPNAKKAAGTLVMKI